MIHRARAAEESARNKLDALNDAVLKLATKDAGKAEALMAQLDPYIAARPDIEAGKGFVGQRIDCVAARIGRRLKRNMIFEDVQAAINQEVQVERPPDVVSPGTKDGGGGALPTGQRLEWYLGDGSEIVIDDPVLRPGRAETANRPHVEFWITRDGIRLSHAALLLIVRSECLRSDHQHARSHAEAVTFQMDCRYPKNSWSWL